MRRGPSADSLPGGCLLITAQNPVMATRLGQDVLPDAERSSYCGQAAGWAWAAACRIGSRHLAAGGVCEDAVGAAPCVVGSVSRVHLALADGVSGGACGDVAAAALVHHSLAYRGSGLEGAVDWIEFGAERVVREALDRHTRAPGATTFASAWLTPEGQARLTRVGDCRAYMWRPPVGRHGLHLRQILPDQTMAYMGYLPPNHPKAVNPAHMVGNGSMGTLEWRNVEIPRRGGLLLCSDGLHSMVAEQTMNHRLSHFLFSEDMSKDDAAVDLSRWVQFCDHLINHAQELGGDDDISVLIALRA